MQKLRVALISTVRFSSPPLTDIFMLWHSSSHHVIFFGHQCFVASLLTVKVLKLNSRYLTQLKILSIALFWTWFPQKFLNYNFAILDHLTTFRSNVSLVSGASNRLKPHSHVKKRGWNLANMSTISIPSGTRVLWSIIIWKRSYIGFIPN